MSANSFIQTQGDGRRYAMMDKSDIIMTKESNAAVLAVCHARGWCASPDYMTKREAERVTDMSGYPFRANQDLTSFDEFRFFTGISALPSNLFYNCKNLRYLTLPESVKTLGGGSLRFEPSSTATHRVIFPESVSIPYGHAVYNFSYGDRVDRIFIFTSPTPPTLGQETSFAPGDGSKVKIYVPDDAISDYQAMANLKEAYLDNFHPLSQCPPEHLRYNDLIGGSLQV